MKSKIKADPDARREQLQEAAHALTIELDTVLDGIEGEAAEELLRSLMHSLHALAQRHMHLIDLIMLDIEANSAILVGAVERRSLVKLLATFDRIKRTGSLRPMPAAVMLRVYLGGLIGHIVTERLMPGSLRFVSRLMPDKAWLDGMTDLLLFGMLEDDAR